MKELGPLSYFQGITVTQHGGGLYLLEKNIYRWSSWARCHVLHRLILNQSLAPKPKTHMRISLFIAVLHVLFNILHSHDRTSSMRYNIFAYLYIIWWMITCMLSSASFASLKVLVIMDYTFIHHPLHHWSPLATMYFSVTIYCRSLTNVNLHYPALVLKLNTTVLSMWCLNLVG